METALLLIVWRRPEETKKLIDSIRPFSPQKIYVASDGPKIDDIDNQKKVFEVRKLIDKEINWGCTLKKFYAKSNKGCKLGVTDAITWFFANEEEGIILEDDCIPRNEFFPYCIDLLERYRYEEKIWCICGNSYQRGLSTSKESYFFSRYSQFWGWATWKRSWDKYDNNMKAWADQKNKKFLKREFKSYSTWLYWKSIWDDIYYRSYPDTWDYQWIFCCMLNSGMVCLPNKDLVENIGFGPLATHTTDVKFKRKFINDESTIFPLIHPKYISISSKADQFIERTIQKGPTLKFYIKYFLKRILILIKTNYGK